MLGAGSRSVPVTIVKAGSVLANEDCLIGSTCCAVAVEQRLKNLCVASVGLVPPWIQSDYCSSRPWCYST